MSFSEWWEFIALSILGITGIILLVLSNRLSNDEKKVRDLLISGGVIFGTAIILFIFILIKK